jgi:hypothetical protein
MMERERQWHDVDAPPPVAKGFKSVSDNVLLRLDNYDALGFYDNESQQWYAYKEKGPKRIATEDVLEWTEVRNDDTL